MNSDDSFDYCKINNDMILKSKFKNLRRIKIPKLNFDDFPEYETTDEEEDGE